MGYPKFGGIAKCLISKDFQIWSKKGSKPRHGGLRAEAIGTEAAGGTGASQWAVLNEQLELLRRATAIQLHIGQAQAFGAAIGDALAGLVSV